MNIVITEFMDDSAVEDLRNSFDVVYDPNLVDQPVRLAELVQDTEALIVRNRTQVRGPLSDSAGALKCVGCFRVGLDNIDCEACADNVITVVPATSANHNAVAKYVITASCSDAAARRVFRIPCGCGWHMAAPKSHWLGGRR